METKIIKLSDFVINQIAAGEVVENPASIVKELVENSIDAGATCIRVDIEKGGQELIRVEDNGCGMSPQDALMCLERHATSKIQTADDLQSLITMGFRGEAMAAISSVSKMEIKTKKDLGTQVQVEGGKVVLNIPCARNVGTTVEVRSLFFNTPARKKFLKSQGSNSLGVARVLETLSIAHQGISFYLNGKKLDPQDVLQNYENKIEFERQNWKITGVLSSASQACSTRSGQYLFINKRPIFSPVVAKAVKEAYGTRIAQNSHPPFVLFIEVAPHLVDVNVHPQKKEARFSDESFLYRLVFDAVSSSFQAPIEFAESLHFSAPHAFSFETRPIRAPIFLEEGLSLPLEFSEKPLCLLGSFLLLQKEKFLLIDLKACHARVLFDSIKHKTASLQSLMWPIEIGIGVGQEHYVEALMNMGIECRLLGDKILAIDALPSTITAAEFPLFFEGFKESGKLEKITSYFSRKGKKHFTIEEAFELWKNCKKSSDWTFDPLGNRIWVEIEDLDLENFMKEKYATKNPNAY